MKPALIVLILISAFAVGIATPARAQVLQPAEAPQSTEEVRIMNDHNAQIALRELATVQTAFASSYGLNLGIASIAYNASKDTTYGASYTDADWQRRFCLANAIEFGLQKGAIQGLHFDDTAFLIAGLPTETADELSQLYRLVVQSINTTERLMSPCASEKTRSTKDAILAHLKVVLSRTDEILRLVRTLEKKLRVYLVMPKEEPSCIAPLKTPSP